MLQVLEHHDRQRFEVLCFGTGHKTDDITQRVRRVCDRYIDASQLSEPAVVEAARREALDIAIDLNGDVRGWLHCVQVCGKEEAWQRCISSVKCADQVANI